jgi:GGDEF domain-containing protein
LSRQIQDDNHTIHTVISVVIIKAANQFRGGKCENGQLIPIEGDEFLVVSPHLGVSIFNAETLAEREIIKNITYVSNSAHWYKSTVQSYLTLLLKQREFDKLKFSQVLVPSCLHFFYSITECTTQVG